MGVFLGTSFLLCSRELSIAIAVATVFHELPQELADYFILVNQCGMTPFWALTFNFIAGMSILLGGILFLAIEMTNMTVGVILAVGGGTFLHVAIAECLGTAEGAQETKMIGSGVSLHLWWELSLL